MIHLLGRKTSSNVMKALWVLEELGLAYDRADYGGAFGGTNTAEYRAKQPVGLVPVVEEDGFSIFESNAILRYLCNAHGGERFYPAEPRARGTIDAWLDFQQTVLSGPTSTYFIGLVRTPPEKRDMAAITAAIAQAGDIWAILDDRIAKQGWVAADHFSIADIAFGVHVHRWFSLDMPGKRDLPNLRAWYDRLLARPPYGTHCAGPLA